MVGRFCGSRGMRWLLTLTVSTLTVGAAPAGAGQSASPDAVDLCGHSEELCGLSSYSGFVPIPGVGALFYWYFEPLRKDPDAPLILWIQGGPGSSSQVANFFEFGPVTLDGNVRLRRRAASESWATNYPVVFVDSPVGTGWSYANDDSGYARNETAVAHALSVWLTGFKALHPEVPNHLVVAGESYAGHYAPALCSFLLSHPGPFTLDAMLIGDGLTDPAIQVLAKPAAAFAFGLIDEKQAGQAQSFAQQSHDALKAGNFTGAKILRSMMEQVVTDASQINVFDVRTTDDYKWQEVRMNSFFGRDEIKKLLHIPTNLIFGQHNLYVDKCLDADLMLSYKPNVVTLLQAGVRVLLYQGQFDWKDGVVPSEAWIRTMEWDGIVAYLDAPREVWRREIDGHIAGYWKRYRNLEQVVVINAGHMVPLDQPLSAADMLSRFLSRSAEDALAGDVQSTRKETVLYT